MKNIDYSNQIQKEAALNEFKGNLFEFLVAQRLARRIYKEDEFLLGLPLEFKNKLSSYEDMVRTHDPKLLQKLPVLAAATVDKIYLEAGLDSMEFSQWNVIGKMVAMNDNDLWNETDVVGTYKSECGENKLLALSIKLSKDHSFVNTKSAGVKSFLLKYFGHTKSIIENMQNDLNTLVDESFSCMGHKLYSQIDQEWTGSFNRLWTDHYTELPGELPPEMRSVVHEFYHLVAAKLSGLLQELKVLDPALFFDSLYSLCGFGHADIIQVNCFHQDYELKNITVKKFADYFEKTNKECLLLPLKELASSFEIIMGDLTLQIRVKPMNKFTTAAYKINCSIKLRDS
jgi:hypothetical protein